MEVTIAANNIVKSFDGKKVLDGISFYVCREQLSRNLAAAAFAGVRTAAYCLTLETN